MSTIYKTLRYVEQNHPDGTPSLEDIVFAHADKNDYSNPTNIRWQELFEDLLTRGRWMKPPKGCKELALDYYDSFGEVLLSDGTPAGLRLSWYDNTLQGVYLFDIPEHRYREALEECLTIGTLLLPTATEISMRNEEGTRTVVVLFGLTREAPNAPLLVKTGWPSNDIEEYARDLHVSDIYEILRAVKGLPAPLYSAGMPSL